MALSRTTLAGAMAATDTEVTLTSITGLSVSDRIIVDGEMMRALSVGSSAAVPVGVYRGVRGSNVVAHPSGASATYGPARDFDGGAMARGKRARDVTSFSVAGALSLPVAGRDMVAIINGTSALAMTVANPTKEADGDVLYIVGNGKAAHTVTYTGGLGAGGSALDVLTFAAGGQQCLMLMAANEVWTLVPSVMAGTLTNITVTAS